MQPLAYNYLNYLSNITVIKSPESSTCCILAPVDSLSITFLLAAQPRKSLNTSEIFFFLTVHPCIIHHARYLFFSKVLSSIEVPLWHDEPWAFLNSTEPNCPEINLSDMNYETFFQLSEENFAASYHYFDPLVACLRFDFENHVKAYLYDNQWSILRQFFWTGSKKVLHNQIRNTLKCCKICLSITWVVIHYVLLSKYSDLS